jgi:prepilin-type N-terminal cleavage/methylation domain-containing protein
MAKSRKRGFTLIEMLAAAVIMIVGIAGLYGGWTVCNSEILNSGEINQAGELARAEIERAKVYGVTNFPAGTYSSGTGTATWTGSFDPTANSGVGAWGSGVSYYNYQGTRLANSTGAAFSIYLTVTDSSVLANAAGTAYTFDVKSRRAIVATVTRLRDGSVLFNSGTNMVLGGI